MPVACDPAGLFTPAAIEGDARRPYYWPAETGARFMRRHRRRAILQVCGLVGMLLAASASSARARDGKAFDSYLLALSWSPSYCLTHLDDREQCAGKGFGFILHGLWPQYRNGDGPSHCPSDAQPGERTIERALAFIPSRHLVRHEWETHGTCSGLDPEEYFAAADRAFAAVTIPPALRAPPRPPELSAADVIDAFLQANPRLRESMISIQCHDGHELSEVRVCLDRQTLQPRACGGRLRSSCRYGTLSIPAVRAPGTGDDNGG
jgi:ribonuclease T2